MRTMHATPRVLAPAVAVLLLVEPPEPAGAARLADATTQARARHTTAERVPRDVRSVDIVVARPGGAPSVRRSLDASAARSLARTVNGLRPAPPGVYSCPMDRGFTDVLTFHGPRGDVRVTARVGGCRFATVTGHGPRRTLAAGGALDDAVTAALGLPRHYGG